LFALNRAIGRAGEETMSLSARAIAVRHAILTITVFVFVSAVAIGARADVQVTSELHALSVEARDTSLQEVLAALAASSDLQYRTSVDLNRPVSGTFRGSLRDITKRLLGDLNYFMRGSDNNVEVIIVGTSSAARPVATSVRPLRPVPTPPNLDARAVPAPPNLDARAVPAPPNLDARAVPAPPNLDARAVPAPPNLDASPNPPNMRRDSRF
jgi:hypothetical protein